MMQSPAGLGHPSAQGGDGQQQWVIMQQPQQTGVSQTQQSHEEVRTLWFGDLQYWMDESYLHGCFVHTGEVQSVKIIRNKQTGYSEGYGFVEFVSHAAAEKILQSFNGTQMPNTDQPFRLNWASFGIGERRPEAGPDHSIFVGDLAPDVTDYNLQETFRSHYSTVKGAKVVTDANTGRSKGYGFVRFGDESERNRAMSEMNGIYCSSRPMRISAATPKKALGPAQQPNPSAAGTPYQVTQAYGGAAPPQSFLSDSNPSNTTIFVGGLDPSVTDEELKSVFGQFGELVYVKIPVGKGCGFVQFTHSLINASGLYLTDLLKYELLVHRRANAEDALQRLQGTVIGAQSVRLSWGRSPVNKQRQAALAGWGQPQQDPNQWNDGGGIGGYYGAYGPGYDQYNYPVEIYGATTDYPGSWELPVYHPPPPVLRSR